MKTVENTPVHHNPISRFVLVVYNKDTYDTVINFHIHIVSAVFDIITPTDQGMEILPMYELLSQLLLDPQDPRHVKNDKEYQLSHGVEPIKHWIVMVDTNCEYVNSNTSVNLSVLWKMDPTMVAQLGKNEFFDKSNY